MLKWSFSGLSTSFSIKSNDLSNCSNGLLVVYLRALVFSLLIYLNIPVVFFLVIYLRALVFSLLNYLNAPLVF